MPRSRTIWKGGKVFAEYEGDKLVYLAPEYQAPKRSDAVSAPMIMRDIGEYTSPIDGQRITSRSQHREHMREHDVIEVGNERLTRTQEVVKPDKELGQMIKHRLDEVAAMPQREYDTHVETQRQEHAAIAALATATL